jgi:hypothetical protein
VRETVLQVACERVGVVAHEDGANASLASRDEDGSEGAFANHEAHLGIRAILLSRNLGEL